MQQAQVAQELAAKEALQQSQALLDQTQVGHCLP